jgi:hypothetical protein
MPEYLNRKEAADYLTARGLKTAPSTLQKFASVGGGPAYSIFGTRAVYTPPNLDAWADAKLSAPRNSTSEIAARSTVAA